MCVCVCVCVCVTKAPWTAVHANASARRRGWNGNARQRRDRKNSRLEIDRSVDRCPPRQAGGRSYIHARCVSVLYRSGDLGVAGDGDRIGKL